jgi:hypothetical protein
MDARNAAARDNVVRLFSSDEQKCEESRWGESYPSQGEWYCHLRQPLPTSLVNAGLKSTLRAPSRQRLEEMKRDQDDFLERIEAPWRDRKNY